MLQNCFRRWDRRARANVNATHVKNKSVSENPNIKFSIRIVLRTLRSGAYTGTIGNVSMLMQSVATSTDGVTFVKPELGINPYNGSYATNIVLPLGGDEYLTKCNCTFAPGGVLLAHE